MLGRKLPQGKEKKLLNRPGKKWYLKEYTSSSQSRVGSLMKMESAAIRTSLE